MNPVEATPEGKKTFKCGGTFLDFEKPLREFSLHPKLP